jgi:hypothetical protein
MKHTTATLFLATAALPLALVQPAHAATFMTADPYFALRLGTAMTAADASHEASFNAAAGELEAGRVEFVYPNAFVFHGFTALGSANTPIGSLTSSLSAAGPPTNITIVVRSRDEDSAYGDADSNGVYTPGVDPQIEHARFRDGQTLSVWLNGGGDLNSATILVQNNLRMSVLLDEGLFTNPSTAGLYTITANLTSVDPDNDGLNDGAGDPPQTFATSIIVEIGGTSLCSTGPSERCLEAGAASVMIKKGSTDDTDSIKWKWGKGQQFIKAATGSPSAATTYELCVYDSSAGLASARAGVSIAAGVLWTDNGSKGWSYKDPDGASDGAGKISLKPAIAGKSGVKFGAKGAAIPMPTPVGGGKFFNQAPSVIVQLRNSNGSCWSSEFTTATTNDSAMFKAKTP